MSERREKFYITTSIPYLNAAPHLGHALEYVQADAIARYQRLQGKDVFFLTGADEHGAKIVRSAEVAGKSPRDFVDEHVKFFHELLVALSITNDDFICTSDQARHWPGAQALWKKLYDAGALYKSFYHGFYCVGHEAFVTEKDLSDGVCLLHKTKPEVIEEENYFFRLSKYAESVARALKEGLMIIIPESRRNEALKMIAEAEDISFSRPSKDIAWGVPVPGDATQTMYVWCDALSNYVSALGFGSADEVNFQKYWPCNLHVIGKDILRFHALVWPAMLIAAGVSLPKTLFVHGYINIQGDKMSKTVGNVIDPLLLREKYGADAVRFYLLHEVPTWGDSDYTSERFAAVYDGLLVNGIGNVLSRTLKMISTVGAITRPSEEALLRYPFRFLLCESGIASSPAALEGKAPVFFLDQNILPAYHAAMARFDLHNAIHMIWELFHALDQYIEEYKIYKALKEKSEEAKIMLWNVAYALAHAGWMLKLFMPETAEKILCALGVESVAQGEWTEFHAGAMAHLFPKI